MWQNVTYMIGRTWREARRALWISCGIALNDVALNLAGLFIAPVVLQKVETASPLPELLSTIGIFALALILLNGLGYYLEVNTECVYSEVRGNILKDINEKACVTSYPNSRDPEFLKQQSAVGAYCGAPWTATQHIYKVLTELLSNGLGFIIYLMLLSNLDLFLIAVVVLTTVAGFFVSNYINGWEYRHREEKATLKKENGYFARKAEDVQLAKDIRIFGLATWLKEVKESSIRAYEAFFVRRERFEAWVCVVDMILLIARNGIAYLYLIDLALTDGLSASQFLLYFSAFTGFSSWVTGLLSGGTTLNKHSLDISSIREFLNYPEPFRFEGGIPIPKADGYELKLENVTFRYPGTEKNILENINLTIRPGEKLAVVGLNGAGKTTLFNSIAGYYPPTSGKVYFRDKDITGLPAYDICKLGITRTFQIVKTLKDMTVEENIMTGAFLHTKSRKKAQEAAKEIMLLTGLYEKKDVMGGSLTIVDKKRVEIARALATKPQVLMLDECMAGLNQTEIKDVMELCLKLRDEGVSLLIVEHIMEAIMPISDKIVVLNAGKKIAEGKPEEVVGNEEVIKAYLGDRYNAKG